MNVLFPVLYCPSSRTEGLASKSPSLSRGLKKWPNLYISSSGRIWGWVGGVVRGRERGVCRGCV